MLHPPYQCILALHTNGHGCPLPYGAWCIATLTILLCPSRLHTPCCCAPFAGLPSAYMFPFSFFLLTSPFYSPVTILSPSSLPMDMQPFSLSRAYHGTTTNCDSNYHSCGTMWHNDSHHDHSTTWCNNHDHNTICGMMTVIITICGMMTVIITICSARP